MLIIDASSLMYLQINPEWLSKKMGSPSFSVGRRFEQLGGCGRPEEFGSETLIHECQAANQGGAALALEPDVWNENMGAKAGDGVLIKIRPSMAENPYAKEGRSWLPRAIDPFPIPVSLPNLDVLGISCRGNHQKK
jgi:hypothetical protein